MTGVLTPSRPQNVVVMDSTNPHSDATDMMTLFPNKFTMETSVADAQTGAVSLVENGIGELTSTKQQQSLLPTWGVMIIFVPCKSRNTTTTSNHRRTSICNGFPVQGTLVMKEEQIRNAVVTCTRTNNNTKTGILKSSVTAFKSLKVVIDVNNNNNINRDYNTGICTLLNLGGGSTVLIVTPELLSSKQGRMMLAKFAAAPQELMNMMSSDDTNDERTSRAITPDDNFTDVLVGETITNDSLNGSAIMTEGREDLESRNDFRKDAPKFRTLDVSLMQMNGQLEPNIPVNTRVGIPFETELFVGSFILILNPVTPQDDPYYHEQIFSKKKRRMILQMQGKFKTAPKGTLFVGGEISDIMKLGLLTKGVSGVLLKLLRAFYPELHFSFGDRKNMEAPHIVFPAHQFFESILMTKPGDQPPPISEMFTETNESRKLRKASKKWSWNTEDTYSLGFHTMHVDLATWRVVHVPMTGDLDLRTFWGNSFATLVMYERGETKSALHLKEKNKYYFSMKVKFLGLNTPASPEEEALSEEEETVTVPFDGPSLVREDSFVNKALERNDQQQSQVFLTNDTESDSEDYFFDAAEADVGLLLEEDLFVSAKSSISRISSTRTSSVRTSIVNVSTIDNSCPAWIEISSSKGKYATVYAFNVEGGAETIYRKSSQFLKYFDIKDSTTDIETSCSPRLSSAERHRRIMGHALVEATSNATDDAMKGNIHEFQTLETPFESTFLQKQSPLLPSSKARDCVLIANVARALHERHWVEEVARIHSNKISFYPPFKSKPTHRISLQNIVHVSKLSRNECPEFPSHHFMAIETLGRTIYLMFKNEKDRDEWIQALTNLSRMPASSPSKSNSNAESSIGSDMILMIDDPTDEFLQKPSLWDCKQRRILNCRKFLFNNSHDETFTTFPVKRSASSLVQDALRRALDPIDEVSSEEQNLRAFLDSACALKHADLSQVVDEREKIAFFLNLYHVMIMHAFLVLGPPDSTFKWLKYFNMISYQCSDDIFSLAELEHCIIRAAMNYPSQFVSKFVLPKSHYSFALTRGDYRINFALNCGSPSNPGFVPIYTADQIDVQLDKTASTYLQRVVEFKKSTKGGFTVTLPKVCQWFADDFCNGSNESVLRSVQKYLDPSHQNILSKITWLGDVAIKYLNYSFECSNLMLEDEQEGVERSLSLENEYLEPLKV